MTTEERIYSIEKKITKAIEWCKEASKELSELKRPFPRYFKTEFISDTLFVRFDSNHTTGISVNRYKKERPTSWTLDYATTRDGITEITEAQALAMIPSRQHRMMINRNLLNYHSLPHGEDFSCAGWGCIEYQESAKPVNLRTAICANCGLQLCTCKERNADGS